MQCGKRSHKCYSGEQQVKLPTCSRSLMCTALRTMKAHITLPSPCLHCLHCIDLMLVVGKVSAFLQPSIPAAHKPRYKPNDFNDTIFQQLSSDGFDRVCSGSDGSLCSFVTFLATTTNGQWNIKIRVRVDWSLYTQNKKKPKIGTKLSLAAGVHHRIIAHCQFPLPPFRRAEGISYSFLLHFFSLLQLNPQALFLVAKCCRTKTGKSNQEKGHLPNEPDGR